MFGCLWIGIFLGIGGIALVNSMQKEIDLDLWLDPSLIQRQNRLKADFLDLFEQLGNSVTNAELTHFFPNSKGKKISKGNQLQGFPYFVLDLIRDFKLDSGCNIRLVSWFGHGLFCCVFFGKNLKFPPEPFLKGGYQLGDPNTPWDLPAQMEWIRKSKSNLGHEQGASLWVKRIQLPAEKNLGLQLLVEEVNKILQVKPYLGIKI
ncbi:MAG: hypothetical protein NBV61_02660 [Algoriphagus sp.]|nr:hypothetical protein [Algoriphagus sp.]